MKILIVGSGFSGSVIANEIAKSKKIKSIDVFDERNHIAGNCHTEKDKLTGIIVHKYGPHIFHTSNKRVWDYINQFDDFENYYHRIKTIHKNKVFSFPINLHTLNQFFNTNLSPVEAEKFLKTKSVNFESPKNFEEQALKFVGKEIYDAFFYGYTKKQWGCDPKDIPASVLKRIPVRFNYDDRYHFSLYSGIPKNGYTHIIESMLDSKKITVHLNTKYNYSDSINNKYDYTFYTGPIDGFFNFKFGRLGYRTVEFQEERYDGDFQGCSQINYNDLNIPFTRITEHKFFTQKKFDNTIIFKEFSKETDVGDIPYYPKRLPGDKIILNKYENELKKLKNIIFSGRLATYRYMDMHQIIDDSLNISLNFLKNI